MASLYDISAATVGVAVAVGLLSVAALSVYRRRCRSDASGATAGTAAQRAARLAAELHRAAPQSGAGRPAVLPPPAAVLARLGSGDAAALALLLAAAESVAAAELRRRLAPADESAAAVDALLRRLHSAAAVAPPFERSSAPLWGLLGFQGEDPTTDFRGGGMLCLDDLVAFAETHPEALRRMLRFNAAQLAAGDGSWFLTAVVSIQFSTSLMLRSPGYDLTQAQVEFVLTHPDGAAGGVRALHHQLLRQFFAAWDRERPFVMDYTQWLGPAVLTPFFSAKWRAPTPEFKSPDCKKMD